MFAYYLQKKKKVKADHPGQYEENDFTTRPINPHASTPNVHNTPSQPGNRNDPDLAFLPPRDRSPARPRRLRTKGHLNEEQHAALAVLSNWELLVTHALNSHRVSSFLSLYSRENNIVLELKMWSHTISIEKYLSHICTSPKAVS